MKAETNSPRVAASTTAAKSGLFGRVVGFTTHLFHLRNRFFYIGHTEKDQDAGPACTKSAEEPTIQKMTLSQPKRYAGDASRGHSPCAAESWDQPNDRRKV